MSYDGSDIPSDRKFVEAGDLNNLVEQAEQFVNAGIHEEAWANPPDHSPVAVMSDPPFLYAADDTAESFSGDGTPYGHHSSGFDTDGYIDKKHILKPEFYGAPAPRMEAVSSQIHHRQTGASHKDAVIFSPSTTGGSWEAIPNTCARIKVKEEAVAYIYSSFFCFEMGGVKHPKGVGDDKNFSKNQSSYGGQKRRAGDVALAIHGKNGFSSDYIASTRRNIYTSFIGPRATARGTAGSRDSHHVNSGRMLFHMLGRHQHNIVYQVYLKPGVYDIGLVCRCRDIGDREIYSSHNPIRNDERLSWGYLNQNKLLFFKAKNMVIDVQYFRKPTLATAGLEEWRQANVFDNQKV